MQKLLRTLLIKDSDDLMLIGPAAPVLDLLHLSLNSSSPAAVKAALHITPSNLTSDDTCSLLSTAIGRSHRTDMIPVTADAAAGGRAAGIGVVTALLAKVPDAQLMPLQELLPLLQLAVQVDAKVDSSRKQLRQLMSVISYEQITAADLAGLLQAAVAGRDLGNVKALLESPATALIDADAMLQLLQEAVAFDDERMVAALVEVPAMSQVSVDEHST
jgi:hypothetical protein